MLATGASPTARQSYSVEERAPQIALQLVSVQRREQDELLESDRYTGVTVATVL
jgi:hypothetical protein